MTVPRCWGVPLQVTSSGNSSGWDFHLVSDAFRPAYPMGLIRSQRNTKIGEPPKYLAALPPCFRFTPN